LNATIKSNASQTDLADTGAVTAGRFYIQSYEAEITMGKSVCQIIMAFAGGVCGVFSQANWGI
jgi:hypothetical protein